MTTPADLPGAPPAPRFFWEDFPVGQVREFGRHEVTRQAVLAFAREFDPQPFHLDDAAAEASLFGRLAASGWHTCAMASRPAVGLVRSRTTVLNQADDAVLTMEGVGMFRRRMAGPT